MLATHFSPAGGDVGSSSVLFRKVSVFPLNYNNGVGLKSDTFLLIGGTMASKNNGIELGNEVLKRERALAAEKLKDMKEVFAQLSKMVDAATILHELLDGFTKKYGMNRQAIDELFGLSSPQLSLIRSSKPSHTDNTNQDAKTSTGQPDTGTDSQSSPQSTEPFPSQGE
jgi:hypothetical protein